MKDNMFAFLFSPPGLAEIIVIVIVLLLTWAVCRSVRKTGFSQLLAPVKENIDLRRDSWSTWLPLSLLILLFVIGIPIACYFGVQFRQEELERYRGMPGGYDRGPDPVAVKYVGKERLKAILKDPDSLEIISERVVPLGNGKVGYECKYRAKNSFGGYTVETYYTE